MARVVVVGGKLQGVEALYLAAKANLEAVLVDRNPAALGQNISSRFLSENVIQYRGQFRSIAQEAALILPALEDKGALDALNSFAHELSLPLVYDEKAYSVAMSKILSDQLFAKYALPAPRYYPDGRYPYITKPSNLSGSAHVRRIDTTEEMERFLVQNSENWVIQEYIEGPSYSIEIIGTPGNYRTYHVTELLMDEGYDCKRVLSRPDLPLRIRQRMAELAETIANLIDLHGIMDLEVIDDGQDLRILEIDARFPSQTPIVVYHATGINLFSELFRIFDPLPSPTAMPAERFVSLEHILVDETSIRVLGEHTMTEGGPLHHQYNFFGADETLTDYTENKKIWRATMIFVADSHKELEQKRQTAFLRIQDEVGHKLNVIE